MKRTLAGLMFLVFAGAGSMMAQNNYSYYHRDRDLTAASKGCYRFTIYFQRLKSLSIC